MLPINSTILQNVFKRDDEHSPVLTPEVIACVLVINASTELPGGVDTDTLNHQLQQQVDLLIRKLARLEQKQLWTVIEELELQTLIMAYASLKQQGVTFLPDDEVNQSVHYSKSMLDFKGKSLREDDQQLRVMSKIKDIENLDRININGSAGSGKTVLLYNAMQLINKMPNAEFVWLSNSLHLLAQIKRKYHDAANLYADTFTNFIEHLIDPYQLWGERYLTLSDDKVVIQELGLVASSEFELQTDLRAIRFTLDNFCQANVMTIKDWMVPKVVQDALKREVILEYAKQYWKLITNYKKSVPGIGISRSHHIKYIQLHTKDIPDLPMNFLVVDECQDLTPSCLYIIKCLTGMYAHCKHHQAQVVMLGDRLQTTGTYINDWGYERVKGVYNPRFEIPTETLNRSHRQGGSDITSLVTKSLHSGGDKSSEEVLFQAVNPDPTRIHELNWSELLDGPVIKTKQTLFIVEDVWTALEVCQKLTQRGVPLYAPLDTLNEISDVISAAIDFYATGLIGHEIFIGYKDWTAFANYHAKKNVVMDRIDTLLKKGFDKTHLKNTLSKLGFGPNKHSITLMHYSKGLESETTYLIPSKAKHLAMQGDSDLNIREAHELYVALTRSNKQIYLPKW